MLPRPRAKRRGFRPVAARTPLAFMFTHKTLIADYWRKREQRRSILMILAFWPASLRSEARIVSIYLFIRMILSSQSSAFLGHALQITGFGKR
jgi:type VI protein secretion system component VasF